MQIHLGNVVLWGALGALGALVLARVLRADRVLHALMGGDPGSVSRTGQTAAHLLRIAQIAPEAPGVRRGEGLLASPALVYRQGLRLIEGGSDEATTRQALTGTLDRLGAWWTRRSQREEQRGWWCALAGVVLLGLGLVGVGMDAIGVVSLGTNVWYDLGCLAAALGGVGLQQIGTAWQSGARARSRRERVAALAVIEVCASEAGVRVAAATSGATDGASQAVRAA